MGPKQKGKTAERERKKSSHKPLGRVQEAQEALIAPRIWKLFFKSGVERIKGVQEKWRRVVVAAEGTHKHCKLDSSLGKINVELRDAHGLYDTF